MILDYYIVKATSGITPKEVFETFTKLYPDYDLCESDYLGLIEDWLQKLRMKPGLALSTGKRNSLRGVLTCSLLNVLGVNLPKATRNRMEVAWAIIDSPIGGKKIGYAPELDAERTL